MTDRPTELEEAQQQQYRIYNRRSQKAEYTADNFKRCLIVMDNWSDDLDGVDGVRIIQKYNEAICMWTTP